MIVDLGAYNGSDTQWMIDASRNPRVIAVEADPDNFCTLAALRLNATIIYGAIADHTGTCDFWACYTGRGRGSGSIRPPSGHLDLNGTDWDFRKLDESIPCYSLDDIFREQGLDHIDLLWVDIQGAERDMIAGGQNALKHSRYLFIESEYEKELYAGQAMRPELLALLPGWTVSHTFDFNLLLRNDAYQT